METLSDDNVILIIIFYQNLFIAFSAFLKLHYTNYIWTTFGKANQKKKKLFAEFEALVLDKCVTCSILVPKCISLIFPKPSPSSILIFAKKLKQVAKYGIRYGKDELFFQTIEAKYGNAIYDRPDRPNHLLFFAYSHLWK